MTSTETEQNSANEAKLVSRILYNRDGDCIVSKLNYGTPLNIPTDRLSKAIKALKQLSQKIRDNKPSDLLRSVCTEGPDCYITLLVSLKSIPKFVKSKHILLDITNPLYNYPSNEVCLIVRDPQRKWKDLLQRDYPDINIITRIIGVGKLVKKYNTFKDKRELCSAYDLFLCDDRVIEKMPKILGSYFIKTNKLPVAIKLRESNLKSTLKKTLSSTFMTIRRGPCVGIRVAKLSMHTNHILQNIQDVIKQVYTYFNDSNISKHWRNEITGLHIQSTDTLALPIWAASIPLGTELKNRACSDKKLYNKDEIKLEKTLKSKTKSVLKK
ncbi:hypothetical protein ACR3K2_23980 [Cryptosporidium serpentis]